jgi:DNA-binding transcriptional LysR family regulator
MEIRELRSLLTLAETGSIIEAAARLHLSPAAIHRQLKILGEELDVTLYERRGRQLRLTGAAETLLPMIRDLFVQYQSTLEAAKDWKGLRRGSLRIGTGPTFATYMLAELLERYRTRYPKVELFVETGQTAHLVDNLRRSALDVLFLVSLSEPAPELAVEMSWDFEVVLVTGPQLGLPGRCSLRDLRDVPFILYRAGSIFENIIDSYFGRHHFQPYVTMRMDNAETIKSMVRSGFGVSMLPSWTLRDELERNTLRIIRQEEPRLSTRVCALRRSTGYVPQSVEKFLQMARGWKWPAEPGSRRRTPKAQKT